MVTRYYNVYLCIYTFTHNKTSSFDFTSLNKGLINVSVWMTYLELIIIIIMITMMMMMMMMMMMTMMIRDDDNDNIL